MTEVSVILSAKEIAMCVKEVNAVCKISRNYKSTGRAIQRSEQAMTCVNLQHNKKTDSGSKAFDIYPETPNWNIDLK
jgi:hypothetical protein